jgi:acetyl esterase/lipase
LLIPLCLALSAGMWLYGRAAPAARADEKGPAGPAPGGLYDVQVVPDIAYYEAPDADAVRHKLDLYLPRGAKDCPVLIFFHGGSWVHGDKSYFGMCNKLCSLCARHGIAAASANYRLSPAVRHPEHVKDVARAVAWAHRNIDRYGGRPDQLFVAGHSAGGHLAALVAADNRFLKAEGLSPQILRGVIPMSGVFQIPEEVRTFDKAFGTDTMARRAASPTCLVSRPAANGSDRALPQFLILYADHDFPLCGREPAEAFCKALQERKAEARTVEVKNRNHATIFANAGQEDDPAGTALVQFITGLCKP